MNHQHGGNFILRARGEVLPARDLAELAERLVRVRHDHEERALSSGAPVVPYPRAEAFADAGGSQYRPLSAEEQAEVLQRAHELALDA